MSQLLLRQSSICSLSLLTKLEPTAVQEEFLPGAVKVLTARPLAFAKAVVTRFLFEVHY